MAIITNETQPRLHQLFAHECRFCGEGNLYYDRPEPMPCDHCGALCAAKAIGRPFEDAVLDDEA